VDDAGNEHRQVGNFTRIDGTTGTATDVWFQRNSLQTIPLEWVDVSSEIQLLPNAKGTGTAVDLHQAMARDNSGVLQSLVTQFVSEADILERTRLVQEIIFHWVGAEAIDMNSRGVIDARRLVALERFAGRDFEGIPFLGEPTSATSNANNKAARYLNEAFLQLEERVYAELMAQTHLQELYDSLTPTWDMQLERVHVDLGGFTGILQMLDSQNSSFAMGQLGEFVRTIRGLGVLESFLSIDDIKQAITPLGIDYQQAIDQATSYDIRVGTDGSDILNFGGAYRALEITPSGIPGMTVDVERPFLAYGGNGDDFIYAGNSNDILLGEAGDDTISDNSGNDIIDGGGGNDTISDNSGNDTIDGGEGNDAIMDFGSGTNMLRGGDGNDTISISYYASNTIEGGAGDDLISVDAPAWSDASYANTFSGGIGNDRIQAGGGTDTYLFNRGDGQDTISDYGGSAYGTAGTDKVVFGADVSIDQLWFRQLENTLEVSIIGTSESMTIENWYLDSAYRVEQFKTTDGAKTLLDSNVQNLVNAMASFAPPAAGQTTLPTDYQTSLAPVIAANWQ